MESKDNSIESLEREVDYYKRLAKYWEAKYNALKAEADLLSGGMLDAVLGCISAGGKLCVKEEM